MLHARAQRGTMLLPAPHHTGEGKLLCGAERRKEHEWEQQRHTKNIPISGKPSGPAPRGWRVSPEPVQPRLPPQPGPFGRSGHALGERGKVGWAAKRRCWCGAGLEQRLG